MSGWLTFWLCWVAAAFLAALAIYAALRFATGPDPSDTVPGSPHDLDEHHHP